MGVFTNELERVSLDEPKRSWIYLERVFIDELGRVSSRRDGRRVYIAVIKTGS